MLPCALMSMSGALITAAGARPEPIRLRPSNGEAKAVGWSQYWRYSRRGVRLLFVILAPRLSQLWWLDRLEMAASGRVGRWAKFMLAGRGRRRPFAVQVFKWVYVEPLRARIAVKDPAALVHRDRSLLRTASLPAPLAGWLVKGPAGETAPWLVGYSSTPLTGLIV